MTNWTAFAGFAGVVVALLLLLARASQSMLSHEEPAASRPGAPGFPTEPGEGDSPPPGTSAGEETAPDADPAPDTGTPDADPAPATGAPPAPMGTTELLANVLVTHGVFALLVVGGAVLWQVPASAFGVAGPTPSVVAGGVAAGVVLYALDEVGAAGAAALGVDHDEALRALLAPDSTGGWVLLLGGVLPVIAVGEELIFRGLLVGVLATGFGLPVWALAVGSSVVFALGHGAQGRGGIVVTGLLGFALAAVFVVSGSLLLVVVAHYVVNALEFVVHEGLGVEWTGG